MSRITSAQILRAIGCQHLALYRGEGYWYWVYDDGDAYDSEMIYVMRLNDASLDRWAEWGRAFLAERSEREETACGICSGLKQAIVRRAA